MTETTKFFIEKSIETVLDYIKVELVTMDIEKQVRCSNKWNISHESPITIKKTIHSYIRLHNIPTGLSIIMCEYWDDGCIKPIITVLHNGEIITKIPPTHEEFVAFAFALTYINFKSKEYELSDKLIGIVSSIAAGKKRSKE